MRRISPAVSISALTPTLILSCPLSYPHDLPPPALAYPKKVLLLSAYFEATCLRFYFEATRLRFGKAFSRQSHGVCWFNTLANP